MNQIPTKPFCASSFNLADMLTMVNLIDFAGHSSKVKATMGIIGKCGVFGDAMLCVVIFKYIDHFGSSVPEGLVVIKGSPISAKKESFFQRVECRTANEQCVTSLKNVPAYFYALSLVYFRQKRSTLAFTLDVLQM